MNLDDVKVAYDINARSLHTLVRVIDPDTGEQGEIMFDNLTTAIALIAEFDLTIVEETIGRVAFQAGENAVTDAAIAWRELASGSVDETLLIVTHGDPHKLGTVTW